MKKYTLVVYNDDDTATILKVLATDFSNACAVAYMLGYYDISIEEIEQIIYANLNILLIFVPLIHNSIHNYL